MSLQERVYSVLVVSASKHFQTVMTELLPASGYEPFFSIQAKRLICALAIAAHRAIFPGPVRIEAS